MTAAAFPPRVALAQALDHYTLIMGWLPGQCLVDPKLPPCAALTLKDVAGHNLTLIGLRPDPRTNSVPMRDCDPMAEAFSTPLFADEPEAAEACRLPAVTLSDGLAKSLSEIMPTTAQCAERRFWAKYGSCSMLSQERYFQRAVDRARELQRSLLNFAIAGAIGSRVKHDALVAAFAQQFGDDSVPSLQIVCGKSKHRNVPVLTEIRLGLRQQGTMRPLSSDGLWHETGAAFRQRCPTEFLIAEPGQPVPKPAAKPQAPGAVPIPEMPQVPAPQIPPIKAPETPTPVDPTKPQPMLTDPVEILPATP